MMLASTATSIAAIRAKLLLSTQLELPVGAILVGAAVELAALLLLEGLLVRRSTKAGLMQRRKRGNVA